MPIELDNTSINIKDGTDTFQVETFKYYTYQRDITETTSNLTAEPILKRLIHDFQVSSVSAGMDYTIFLYTNGKVYATGYNEYGQLGIGNTQDQYTPVPIPYFNDNNDIQISAISAGTYHTIFLDDTTGKVYATGWNYDGQLGIGNTQDQYTPVPIPYFNDNNNIQISAIFAGGYQTIFLDTNGKLYATGNNGQFGIDNTQNQNTPVPIPYFNDNNNIQISAISARVYHTIFLDDTTGKVYATGWNYYGQLGIGNTQDQYTPVPIPYFNDNNNIQISAIFAGAYHTIFLDTNGKVYATGYNNYGQLGIDNTQNQNTPVHISYSPYVVIASTTGTGSDTNHKLFTLSTVSSYTISFPISTVVNINNGSDVNLIGDYIITLLPSSSSIIPTEDNSLRLIPFSPTANINSIIIKYHLRKPVIAPFQWTYSDTDASVYHLGNVGIGTYPSNTKILNVNNGINLTDDLYLNTALISTPKYKHTHIRENNKYFPDVIPSISPTYIPNSNEYHIYSFVYDDSNNNGNGQTEYTINFHEETECDILIVAGGGSGGKFGGGGGSGAILFKSKISLNGSCSIEVGKGGIGTTSFTNGENGKNSSITINATQYIVVGGGGGGGRIEGSPYTGRGGNNGGSGGGGSCSNTITTANAGGSSIKYIYTGWESFGNSGGEGKDGESGLPTHASGGGGGAGSVGSGITSTGGGNGGAGKEFISYFGTNVGHNGWFGGGGGGNVFQNAGNPGYANGGNGLLGGGGNGGYDGTTDISGGEALPNTGGGGGGSKYNGGTAEDLDGGNGGSGIVIIRCKIVTSDLNVPALSSGVITELNKFDQYNTLTFNYDTNYLKNVDYPLLAADATNLIAWYKFDAVPSNGATIINYGSGGSTYDATVYGDPEHISPYTISFNVGDGSQYLLFPIEVIKDSGITRDELTFSIWVNKKESSSTYVTYFSIDNNTDGSDLSKSIFFGQSQSGPTYIHFRYGSSTVNINTAYDNIALNVWNHYAFVLRKDGSNANIKFYVNEIEYTAYDSNVVWIELDDYLKINRWVTGIHNDNINKHIRDFRIYDKALSQAEITELYIHTDIANNQSKYTLQFDTDTECDFLVVAGGGGGGGNNNYRAGGGGGAGELLEKYNITFSANTLYTIIVGNGGLGQPAKTSPAIEGYDSGIYTGTDGDTPFYHSKGGGRGGNGYYDGEQIFDATSGGSGGGAGMMTGANNNVNGLSVKYNTDGRGHDGKVNVTNDAGGGGGAGSIGEYASSSLGQAQSLPGKGYTSYITGEAVTYASGGYGGWQYSNNIANAGKGSGGWGYGGPPGGAGFPGGNGIDGTVIIRYKYVNTKPEPTITYSMNSWTYTDDGNVYYMGNVGIGINDPTATLHVEGSISATSKQFKIQHPLDNSKSLYHGNIECPRYDNLYRGRTTIINGTCIVDIDSECNDTGGLIEGTFHALNTDSQLYLQNNQTFDNVKGTIENGKIHIECENTEDEITINWIVIAERKDADVVKLNNTDSNGKMICEYFK